MKKAPSQTGLFSLSKKVFRQASDASQLKRTCIRERSVGIFNPGKKCGIVGRNIGYAASFSLGISTAPMAL